MSPDSLRECLLTRERAKFTVRIGALAPRCNEPPFSSRRQLELWSWSWTEWPTFNQSVFEEDLKRVLRWYRARGFYDAQVKEVWIAPAEAGRGLPCQTKDCSAEVRVLIDEGEPIRVQSVRLSGIEQLSRALRSELRQAVKLEAGDRFDEAAYDQSKVALEHALRRSSFAEGRIRGSVEVDPLARRARLTFRVERDRSYRFGSLRVRGRGRLPEAPIRAAAGFVPGELYSPDRLETMRVEVLALGAFSTVDVQEVRDAETGDVDITLALTPRARRDLRLGVGLTSGASRRTETGDTENIPQWDLHLFGRYELRHVANTLGTFRIENQPRLLFGDVFPNLTAPGFGNVATMNVNQPGLIEARTDLFGQSSWDYGPDPFLGFVRSDIVFRVGLRRNFFTRHLAGTLALQEDVFVVDDDADNVTTDGSPRPASYHYAFVEEDLRLDLRDRATQPSRGAYFALNSTQSLRSGISDWTSLRLAPDARFYFSFPFATVFAARAALGALLIADADSRLDDLSRRLGPSSYRLRGGGASSVRGFLPGRLGAGTQGGLRRWETMLEWRVPFGASMTAVCFMDFGDVNDGTEFRFGHLNTTAGLGFRYFTPLGPLRLDAGFRIIDWQRTDGSRAIEEGASMFPFTSTPGALHLTIGDSF